MTIHQRSGYDSAFWGPDELRTLEDALNNAEAAVKRDAEAFGDMSIYFRYTAVTDQDTKVDEAQQRHFAQKNGQSFWPIYSKAKSRKAFLDRILDNLGD